MCAQQRHLHRVDRIDVRIAQADRPLHHGMPVEQVVGLDDAQHHVGGARVLVGDAGEVAVRVGACRHEIEVRACDLEARLRERHLEVLDDRPEEGPVAVETPQLVEALRRSRGSAPGRCRSRTRLAAGTGSASRRTPTGWPAATAGTRHRRRAGAPAAIRSRASASSSTGVNDAEERHERRVAARRAPRKASSERRAASVISSRPNAGARRPDDSGEDRQQRRRQRRLEVAVRQPRQPVLERDRLALLGELEAAARVAAGLREDRRVRRTAAAAGAAAAAVEDRQLDAVPRRHRRRGPPGRGRSPTAPPGSRRPWPNRSSRPSPPCGGGAASSTAAELGRGEQLLDDPAGAAAGPRSIRRAARPTA